jgi:adenylate cyclase
MRFNWLFSHSNAPRSPVLVALLVLVNALLLRAVDPDALGRLQGGSARLEAGLLRHDARTH